MGYNQLVALCRNFVCDTRAVLAFVKPSYRLPKGLPPN